MTVPGLPAALVPALCGRRRRAPRLARRRPAPSQRPRPSPFRAPLLHPHPFKAADASDDPAPSRQSRSRTSRPVKEGGSASSKGRRDKQLAGASRLSSSWAQPRPAPLLEVAAGSLVRLVRQGSAAGQTGSRTTDRSTAELTRLVGYFAWCSQRRVPLLSTPSLLPASPTPKEPGRPRPIACAPSRRQARPRTTPCFPRPLLAAPARPNLVPFRRGSPSPLLAPITCPSSSSGAGHHQAMSLKNKSKPAPADGAPLGGGISLGAGAGQPRFSNQGAGGARCVLARLLSRARARTSSVVGRKAGTRAEPSCAPFPPPLCRPKPRFSSSPAGSPAPASPSAGNLPYPSSLNLGANGGSSRPSSRLSGTLSPTPPPAAPTPPPNAWAQKPSFASATRSSSAASVANPAAAAPADGEVPGTYEKGEAAPAAPGAASPLPPSPATSPAPAPSSNVPAQIASAQHLLVRRLLSAAGLPSLGPLRLLADVGTHYLRRLGPRTHTSPSSRPRRRTTAS